MGNPRDRADDLAQAMPAIGQMLGYLESGLVAACAAALARTGAADHFKVPSDILGAAQAAKVNPEILERMVRFMAGHDFFTRSDAGEYKITELGRLLCTDSRFSAKFRFMNGLDATAGLSHTLLTGESAFAAVFGTDFWSWLSTHDGEAEAFAEAMAFDGLFRNPACVPLIKVKPGAVVADLGGGGGQLLAAVLKANPQVAGILVDQPAMLAHAVPEMVCGDLAERCTLLSSDMLTSIPPADVYILARVLHDWPDADAARILVNARRSAKPNATLYLLESLLPPAGERNPAHASDISMMALFGRSRERTEAEQRELLACAGWSPQDLVARLATTVLRATAAPDFFAGEPAR